MDKKPSTVTIREDGISMIFIAHNEWKRLTESNFSSIQGYRIVCMFNGSGGVYQILKDMTLEALYHDNFKFLKVVTDEETGKCILYIMDIPADEAKQLIDIRNAIWEN